MPDHTQRAFGAQGDTRSRPVTVVSPNVISRAYFRSPHDALFHTPFTVTSGGAGAGVGVGAGTLVSVVLAAPAVDGGEEPLGHPVLITMASPAPNPAKEHHFMKCI